MKVEKPENTFVENSLIMNKVLIINASPRAEKSRSRKLTTLFLENWKSKYPDDSFIYREVGRGCIPHISEDWIAAAFKNKVDRTDKDKKALELSDELIKELKDANIYVLGVPMYNWSIPSSLKAYIDQIMRINETWRFKSGKPDGHYLGLLQRKKMYILSSRGDSGYDEGEENEHMNYQTTYLKTVFAIMGINEIEIISLNNEEYGDERFANSVREVHLKIQQIE